MIHSKRFDFSFSDNDTAPKPCPIHERQLEQIRSVRRIGWKRGGVSFDTAA
jgi:hypothetical protein